VLDLDSHEVGAFDDADHRGLALVLRAAGFTLCGDDRPKNASPMRR
jgi:hypothetical protein